MSDSKALDPQARAFLDRLNIAGRPALSTLTPGEARIANAMLTRLCAGPPVPVGRVDEREIPGPRGPIRTRVYEPLGDLPEPRPVLVYFHGGGFLLGDLDMVDATCRMLANATPCVVVSVEYRLAPEFPYPAPREDAYAAATWVVREAASLGWDPSRVAIGGDSAGGALAAIVALVARDSHGPSFCFQLLVYPPGDRDPSRPSMRDFSEDYFLTRDAMQWFSKNHYAGPPVVDPYLTPIEATDLSRLPPALVITAGFDPLRDGGEAYAKRLMDAGVPTELVRYGGMIHGFYAFPFVFDVAREAIARSATALARAFATRDAAVRDVAAQVGSRSAE